MLSTVATTPQPLECETCLGSGIEPGRRLRAHSEGFDGECSACSGTGHVRCEDCDEHPSEALAVTTSLTDRSIKLCAKCAVIDERDCREWLTATGLSAESIERFFALAPTLTDAQRDALIPLPTEEYIRQIELMVARKEAA